ncbi:MAG: hypothetical protein JOZ19_11465 [Rubrobacter sp.]|nr:hypothetical protein [Rubrobacter sp.]
MLARDNVIGSSSWLLLFVPVSFLVFSFRQYENMLFGYQINFALAEAFGVLALFLLYVLGRRSFKKLAFVRALVSDGRLVLCPLQGLFVWPAGLLQLFISPIEKPKKRVFVVLWGLFGLGEWVGYFVDYAKPRSSPSLIYLGEFRSLGESRSRDSVLSALAGQLVVRGSDRRPRVRFPAGLFRPGEPPPDLQGQKVGRVSVLDISSFVLS